MNQLRYLSKLIVLVGIIAVIVEQNDARKVVVKKVKKTIKRIPLSDDGAANALEDPFSKPFDLIEEGSNHTDGKFHLNAKDVSRNSSEKMRDGYNSRTRDSGGKWRKGENGEMIYERTVITESSRRKSKSKHGHYMTKSLKEGDAHGEYKKHPEKHSRKAKNGYFDENERKLKRKGGFIFNMDEETQYSSSKHKKNKHKHKNIPKRKLRKLDREEKKGTRYGYMMDVETTVDTMHRWDEVDSENFCGSKGWNEFNGHCYKIITRPMNNADAHKACEAEDAHLASIHNNFENDFVTMLTAQLDYTSLRNPDKGVWIGMTRKPGDGNLFKSEWHDKSTPIFGHQEQNHPAPNKFPWRPGQPDNAHGHEWCVHIYPFYHNDGHSHHAFMSQWNDFNCDEIMDASVCKKPSQCGFVTDGDDEDDYEDENDKNNKD